MKVKLIDRSISQREERQANDLRWRGYLHWRGGRFHEALHFYRQDLNLRLAIQKKEGRPVHKGGPLHMMGFILLFQEQTEDALQHFLLAYIEDTLNVNPGSEDDADLARASYVLTELFRIKGHILTEIKQVVLKKKLAGLWSMLDDPQQILQEITETLTLTQTQLLSQCKSIPSISEVIPIFSSCMF